MITSEEGLVVDVITNETHPEYSSDGFNFGLIRVRLVRDKSSLSDALLEVAHPMHMNDCALPLIGEVVILHKIAGYWHYYPSRISVTKNINMESAIGHNELENVRGKSAGQTTSPTGEHEFSKTKEKFAFDENIRGLRPFTGDHIIQGRFGNSIRFGHSYMDKTNPKGKLAPNLILRVGQSKIAPQTVPGRYGLILEDINDDATSLWLVADQAVPFVPARGDTHLRSSGDTSFETKGSQLFAVSDQIVLNSKKRSIYLFSGKDVSLSAMNSITMDADNQVLMSAIKGIESRTESHIFSEAAKNITLHAGTDVIIQAENATHILGNKVLIGRGDATADQQPMVLGTKLAEFLRDFILILANSGIVGLGTLGPVMWNPAILIPMLDLIPQKLALSNTGQATPMPVAGAIFNSKDNFVSETNKGVIP